MSAVSPKVRAQVLSRCGGLCERCGAPLDSVFYSLQHRKARGMGSTKRPEANAAANLAAVCGSATSPGQCHQWIESHPDAAILDGWRVPSWDDPVTVPITHWQHGQVYLNAAAGYASLPDVAA